MYVKVKAKPKVGRFSRHSLYYKLAVLPINFVNQCLQLLITEFF